MYLYSVQCITVYKHCQLLSVTNVHRRDYMNVTRMLNSFHISLPETRRDFASSRSALTGWRQRWSWQENNVQVRLTVSDTRCEVVCLCKKRAALRVECGTTVWHNGVARHWQCGSLCQLTTTVAPPEGSRLLRLAVGPRQPASSEDLFRSAAFRDWS